LKSSNKPLEIHILTLFPEACAPVLGSSLMKRAASAGLVKFNLVQIRDFATDKHRTVDASPYGGGEGMVMRADVLHRAWKSVVPRASKTTHTVLLSPQGRAFTQAKAAEFRGFKKLVLICGHYEGVDERFIEECVDEELSIGDFILTGGELAALVVADVVTRLVPGVVGNPRSITEDTFGDGTTGGRRALKYPQYTRPPEFLGRKVPGVLLTGDHGKIERWRNAQREERTRKRRPDLLDQ
jgi:tRNA (guanine37-N1)-methyltransferase